jgi:transposase InsO family protein
MEAAFCVETLEDALARHGKPDIFNTDQGSQFTGAAFTGVLTDNGMAISMDGKGAWRDNVFVERLWRSVKYEEVYLRALSWNPRSLRTDMHLKFSRLRPQTCRANSACCCQMNTDK